LHEVEDDQLLGFFIEILLGVGVLYPVVFVLELAPHRSVEGGVHVVGPLGVTSFK
jgi:hypothetical protein